MNKGIYDIFNLLYLNVITLIVLFISLVLIFLQTFLMIACFFIIRILAYKLAGTGCVTLKFNNNLMRGFIVFY